MSANFNYSTRRVSSRTTSYKAWEALKLGAFYWMLFVLLVLNVHFYASIGKTIIQSASLLMALIALISYALVPTERPNMINGFKRSLFLYLASMIAGRFVISLLTSIDPGELAVAIGLNAGQTQSNALQGWLVMMVQFGLLTIPIAFLGVEIKRIFQYCNGSGFGHVTKRKRMEQLQKTIVR